MRPVLEGAAVVLVAPTHPGNVGAVARAMKNAGVRRLLLVAPVASHLDQVALARAAGAEDILDDAVTFDTLDDAIGGFEVVMGTSARTRKERGWKTPRAAAPGWVEVLQRGARVALVFGQERAGLTNEQLDRCTEVCRIPTDPEFSSLNLAQAVTLLTYELRVAVVEAVAAAPDEAGPQRRVDQLPATADELEALFAHYERSLTASGFTQPHSAAIRMRFLRKLLGRARLTSEEAQFLHGIAERIDWLLGKASKGDT